MLTQQRLDCVVGMFVLARGTSVSLCSRNERMNCRLFDSFVAPKSAHFGESQFVQARF